MVKHEQQCCGRVTLHSPRYTAAISRRGPHFRPAATAMQQPLCIIKFDKKVCQFPVRWSARCACAAVLVPANQWRSRLFPHPMNCSSIISPSGNAGPTFCRLHFAVPTHHERVKCLHPGTRSASTLEPSGPSSRSSVLRSSAAGGNRALLARNPVLGTRISFPVFAASVLSLQRLRKPVNQRKPRQPLRMQSCFMASASG